MRLLLDTHVLLWWLDQSPQLGSQAQGILRASANELWFSSASPFEIAIKIAKGKLKFDLANALTALKDAGFRELSPIDAHYVTLTQLDPVHGDPFDRLIVAQAIVEGMTIMTEDRMIRRYPVRTIDCS